VHRIKPRRFSRGGPFAIESPAEGRDAILQEPLRLILPGDGRPDRVERTSCKQPGAGEKDEKIKAVTATRRSVVQTVKTCSGTKEHGGVERHVEDQGDSRPKET